MDYTLLIISAVICIVVGYVVIKNISYISSFSIIIALAATSATAASLLYSSGRMVIDNNTVQLVSQLSRGTVEKVCGEKDIANTLCYKEVEYRGYPFKVFTIEYPYNSEARIVLYDSLGRGGGLFTNFAIYLFLISLLAALIKRVSLSRSPKSVQ